MKPFIVISLTLLISSTSALGIGLSQEDQAFIKNAKANAEKRAESYRHEIEALTRNNNAEATPYKKELESFNTSKVFSLKNQFNQEGKLIAFLSFSMPEESLKEWLRDCKKAHIAPVIRGLANNSFKDTLTRLYKIEQEAEAGLQIDPLLFREFEVKRVPTVVSVYEAYDCPSNMDCKPSAYDEIAGNAGLAYLLHKLKYAHPTKAIGKALTALKSTDETRAVDAAKKGVE